MALSYRQMDGERPSAVQGIDISTMLHQNLQGVQEPGASRIMHRTSTGGILDIGAGTLLQELQSNCWTSKHHDLQGRLAKAVQGVRMHQLPVKKAADLLHVATGRCATQPVADADFFQKHSGYRWTVKPTQPQAQLRSGLGNQQELDQNSRDCGATRANSMITDTGYFD